ncbi:MAG: glycosyltransferase family 2 protein [Acidimicrobiia bacterium]
MSSPPVSPAAPSSQKPPASPAVALAVLASPSMELEETLAAIGKQVYVPAQVLVVGGSEEVEPQLRVSGPEDIVGRLAEGIAFVWWIHGDSRPRPDALAALVEETLRNDAAVAGSKILTADDRLEAVGGATDVFGDPYTGLDPGELDLEQYDVVREVAFVSAVSLLVRRDLLRGLGGFDRKLPLQAAGLDFCQRARVAGGRVIVVPSSEVFHQSPCVAKAPSWQEQGGRHKAMLVAYRPITLAWVVPVGGLVGLVDGLGQIVLGRFGPIFGAVLSWLWVTAQIPSVLGARRRLKRVRSVGDEELFRFQVAGSTRLRRTASELGDRFNRALDEEESGSLADRARSAWRRPSLGLGVASSIAVLIATRGIWFAGPPQVGFALPPSVSGLVAAYGGGLNPAGFGSDLVPPPIVGFASLVHMILGRRPLLAGALITLAAAALALTGMARLARRSGAGTVGSAIAGWAYMGGATAVAVAASGNWPALIAAGPLPWALDSILATPATDWRRRIGRYAVGGLAAGLVAVAYPPLLVVVSMIALIWAVAARRPQALVAGLATTALGAGLVLPYIVGADLFDVLLAGNRPVITAEWLWLLAVGAGLLVSALWGNRSRLPGIWLASFLIGGGYLVSQLPTILPAGSVVALLAAALGSGLVASVLVELRIPMFRAGGAMVTAMLLIPALLVIGQGRLGLPGDEWSGRLDFVETLSAGVEPGRALLIGPPDTLPGETRSMFGFDYRTVDGGLATLTQAYLSPPGLLDQELERTVTENLLGGVGLRPGEALAQLGIEWLVVVPGSTFPTEVLDRQVDLAQRPVATGLGVYQNLVPVDEVSAEVTPDPLLRLAGWISLALGLVLLVAGYWGRGRVPQPVMAPDRIEEMAVAS